MNGMRKTIRLTKVQKTYVLRALASYCEYDEITANVMGRFNAPNGDDEWDKEMLKVEIQVLHEMLSDLPQELRQFFLQERAEYLRSINDLPISSLNWRLKRRTQLLNKAEENEDFKLANDILNDAALDMGSAVLDDIRDKVAAGEVVDGQDRFRRKAENE